jgi:D-aspartate ligase
MQIDRARRPAIAIGGDLSALSVTRSLSRAGIPVYLLNRSNAPARCTRLGHWFAGLETPRDWRQFLLGSRSDDLAGAVILACSDEAIEMVIDNWDALSAKFILEECPPGVRRGLLDKLFSYERAKEGGFAVPEFVVANSPRDIELVEQRCRFPVVLKPRLSHDSMKIGQKYLRANDRSELSAQLARLAHLGVPVVMMEFIPGSDDQSHSYYTYMDEDGTPLVNFTKSLLRRHPVNQGIATYHTTEWNEEVAELGLRFFRHVGLRGLGHVEFKRDARDGKLKIIEANARFTGANVLIRRCGIDLALITYNRLTRRPQELPKSYSNGLVMWHPLEDIQAFAELRKRGEINWGTWLRDISRTDQLPYFDWRDPAPSLAACTWKGLRTLRYALAGLVKSSTDAAAWNANADADSR